MDSSPGITADTGSGDTVLAGLVQHVINSAATKGLSAAELLAAAGLSPEQLADPNGRVPASCMERLVCAGARISKDPLLGLHMSEVVDPAGFGVTGHIRQVCSTLQEVIEMTMRYERLVSDIGHTSLLHQPGIALWAWACKTDNPVFERHATEYILGCWLSIQLRLMKPDSQSILAVHLRHDPPSAPELLKEYQRALGCPVHFRQPVSALVFSADAMRLPLAHANASIQQVLEEHARHLLEQHDETATLPDRARAQLGILLRQGKASRESLAGSLGMSTRHLHRQLEHDGFSYRKILDEQRMELALHYLAESKDSIEAVAERLQFTESQSFIRWFRQRAGKTPGQYRQGLKNG